MTRLEELIGKIGNIGNRPDINAWRADILAEAGKLQDDLIDARIERDMLLNVIDNMNHADYCARAFVTRGADTLCTCGFAAYSARKQQLKRSPEARSELVAIFRKVKDS